MEPVLVVRRDHNGSLWDGAVAGGMVGVAVVALLTRIDVQEVDSHRFEPDTWWSWVVTIAVCAALFGRRRWPLTTLALVLALVLPLELGNHRDSIAFFALVIAVASVATFRPPKLTWRAVAMVAALYGVLVARDATLLIAAPAISPVMLAAGFALGRMMRRGQASQELEVEAAIERGAVAVEKADLAAAEERLRVAQDLHDVVAHTLSVIAVQAGIGVHLIEREPAQAAVALEAIRATGVTASGELARLVQVIRGGGSTDAAKAPAINAVALLVDQIRTAGVPIAFTTHGALDEVPAGVSLAAYRIVQEALTNVVRHAGHAQATVTVEVTDDHVKLCVDDDGRGTTTALDPGSPGSGRGLIGMAERAEMYGGDVRSGARPGGGFRVQATIPYFADPIPNKTPPSPAIESERAQTNAQFWRRIPPRLWDLGLALLLAVVAAIELHGADPKLEPHYSPTNFLTWLLKVGCCLALVARRRYPTATFAAVWAMSLALNIGGHKVGLLVFALDISLFTVARYASARRTVGAVTATYALLAIIASSEPREVTTAAAVWIGILFTAVATGGHVAGRDRQRRTTDLAARENAADANSRRALLAITTERLRIADELSMIVTRSIQRITQEAEAGLHSVNIDPGATGRTLERISAISRDALSDLRRLLKRIRTNAEPVAYSPVLADLNPVAVGEL